MATAELVLGLLSRGPAHGYDVKRGHDAWFPDGRPLAFGQVYTTLSRLERDGLVEVVEKTSGGGPDRTVYALTEKGRKHLADWLADPVPPAWGSADEMLRKLVAAVRTGGDATVVPGPAASQPPAPDPRAAGDRRPVRTDLRDWSRDYIVAHLDADLRWLDNALDRITLDRSAEQETS